MSLSRGQVNPLSVLGFRKLTFIPEHFARIKVNKIVDLKLLDQWINYNLNSRYALVKRLDLDNDKKMVEVVEIGIEDPKEITILTLGCPYIHKN
jgi:hypothetical protein